MNPSIGDEKCWFTHPWLADDVDPWIDRDDLVDSLDDIKDKFRKKHIPWFFGWFIAFIAALLFTLIFACRNTSKKHKFD